MRKILTDQRYGRLLVIADLGKVDGDWSWLCLCSCGNKTIATTAELNRKEDSKRSCGCGSRDARIKKGQYSGDKNPRWNGGKTVDYYGYTWVTVPDHPYATRGSYVREHRIVMEKAIGRFLKPEESIHHINFDKSDNRIENLILFSSESDHQKHHQALKRESNTIS